MLNKKSTDFVINISRQYFYNFLELLLERDMSQFSFVYSKGVKHALKSKIDKTTWMDALSATVFV